MGTSRAQSCLGALTAPSSGFCSQSPVWEQPPPQSNTTGLLEQDRRKHLPSFLPSLASSRSPCLFVFSVHLSSLTVTFTHNRSTGPNCNALKIEPKRNRFCICGYYLHNSECKTWCSNHSRCKQTNSITNFHL